MNHHHHPEKPKFDLMAHIRKPHGIALLALIVGTLGWAVWTFVVW